MEMTQSRLQIRRWILVLSVLFVTVASDQLTKVLARSVLRGQDRQEFIAGSVALEFAENPGAFLSVGSGLSDSLRFLIFSVGVVFVLLWAGYLLIKRQDLAKMEVWGLALLLGGGIGNLIDRLSKGTVTDFIQMGVGSLHTGIFNIADVAIMVGVGFLFLTSSRNKKKAAAKTTS